MTRFYLVRHGETDWNIQGRWQGFADIPLNEDGWAQARLLAARFTREEIALDAIYTSDLLRAYDTAMTLSAALGTPVHRDVALREIDLGRWSGLTKTEVQAQFPELLARTEAGEDLPRGETGERFADVIARATAAVQRLADAHPDGNIALISHGGTVRALLGYAASHGGHPPPRGFIGNTSLSVIEVRAGVWQTQLLNDTSHLTEVHNQPAGDEATTRSQDER